MFKLESLTGQHERICALAHRIAVATSHSGRHLLIAALRRELESHLYLEETYLFPPLEAIADLQSQVRVLREEGEELRRLLGEVATRHQDGPAFYQELQKFTLLLEDHCRMEELELFRDAKSVLSDKEVQSIRLSIEKEIQKSSSAA